MAVNSVSSLRRSESPPDLPRAAGAGQADHRGRLEIDNLTLRVPIDQQGNEAADMGKVADQHQRFRGRIQLAFGEPGIVLRGQPSDLAHPGPRRDGTRQDLRRLFCPEFVGMKYLSDHNFLCRKGARYLLHSFSARVAQRAPRIFMLGLGLAVPDQKEFHIGRYSCSWFVFVPASPSASNEREHGSFPMTVAKCQC